MSIDEDFFEERLDQSEIKSRIVAKFFASWSRVILGATQQAGRPRNLAYVELFCGPGQYDDGTKSTPLIVMEHIIETSDLRENVVTTFIDNDPNYTASLKHTMAAMPGYDTVKHPPRILCREVNSHTEEMLSNAKMVPTLSFIDPFGYKGLTMNLIKAISKDWGSDCIFFFNYRRINAAISNDNFVAHLAALFEQERAEQMRREVGAMRPAMRLDYILGKLNEVLAKNGLRYTIAFKFKEKKGNRTTYALVYVTKKPKGFCIMRDIMANESSSDSHGVPTYEFCPSAKDVHPELDLDDRVGALANTLASKYAGRRIRVQDILDTEQPTRFLDRNIKDAICRLELAGRLTAEPPATRRWRANQLTCGPNVVLTFATGLTAHSSRAA